MVLRINGCIWIIIITPIKVGWIRPVSRWNIPQLTNYIVTITNPAGHPSRPWDAKKIGLLPRYNLSPPWAARNPKQLLTLTGKRDPPPQKYSLQVIFLVMNFFYIIYYITLIFRTKTKRWPEKVGSSWCIKVGFGRTWDGFLISVGWIIAVWIIFPFFCQERHLPLSPVENWTTTKYMTQATTCKSNKNCIWSEESFTRDTT